MQMPNHDFSTSDSIIVQVHGHSTTHLDALGHMFWEGTGYNGRLQTDVVSSTGLRALDIDVMKDGIFTRGVFLDVARAAGVDYLQPTETVTGELLERAVTLAGVQIAAGDAVFVHTGLERRVLVEGPEDPATRCGLDLSSVLWLHQNDISVYAGDCIEKLPASNGRVKLPLHQIGLASMGLVILDCPSLTDLADVCDELARSSFLLVVAPLRIPGATGSPANPIAVF
jgi:kynurenine formamidase